MDYIKVTSAINKLVHTLKIQALFAQTTADADIVSPDIFSDTAASYRKRLQNSDIFLNFPDLSHAQPKFCNI